MSQNDPGVIHKVHCPDAAIAKHAGSIGSRRRYGEFSLPTVEVNLPGPSVAPPAEWVEATRVHFERERQAFLRLLPTLLTTHRGLYVAVHDERVVDSGPDRLALALRAQARVRGGVYVGLIGDEPEPICRSGIRRDLTPGESVP